MLEVELVPPPSFSNDAVLQDGLADHNGGPQQPMVVDVSRVDGQVNRYNDQPILKTMALPSRRFSLRARPKATITYKLSSG